jgi:hypothetical protein
MDRFPSLPLDNANSWCFFNGQWLDNPRCNLGLPGCVTANDKLCTG